MNDQTIDFKMLDDDGADHHPVMMMRLGTLRYMAPKFSREALERVRELIESDLSDETVVEIWE